jgi:hypothetical protein
VRRAVGINTRWRRRLHGSAKQRLQFLDCKLDVLDEQEEIRWLCPPAQPSLQEAGVERKPLGAVFSFL